MAKDMDPIQFSIERSLAVLGPSGKNWNLELNMVSWNERPAKLDIRSWDPEHKRMGKGITLSREEAEKLKDALITFFAD